MKELWSKINDWTKPLLWVFEHAEDVSRYSGMEVGEAEFTRPADFRRVT